MFESITETIIPFVRQYGYLVIFVFMFLETSMVFPFIPSEIVVPVSVGLLITGPVSFCLFVLAATAGATTGSVFAYYAFGATSYAVVERYGQYVRISERNINRARIVFHQWGECTVFWARLLPIVRSLISIPAGFSEMDLKKFTAYSAAGSAAFMALYTTGIYFGLQLFPWTFTEILQRITAYATAHPLLVLVVCGLIGALSLVVCRTADQYIDELLEQIEFKGNGNR